TSVPMIASSTVTIRKARLRARRAVSRSRLKTARRAAPKVRSNSAPNHSRPSVQSMKIQTSLRMRKTYRRSITDPASRSGKPAQKRVEQARQAGDDERADLQYLLVSGHLPRPGIHARDVGDGGDAQYADTGMARDDDGRYCRHADGVRAQRAQHPQLGRRLEAGPADEGIDAFPQRDVLVGGYRRRECAQVGVIGEGHIG